MTNKDRKEAIIVIVMVGLALTVGLLSSLHQPVLSVKAEKAQNLAVNDFVLKIHNEQLIVGKSSWSEATAVFPHGRTLGMSTVYSADPEKYLLTFTEKENILCKADIYSSDIKTFRNITVGMDFDRVKSAYGDNYTKISSNHNPSDFDVVYGSQNCLVFNIRNNMVDRIVIQRD
jgi:hypothetical protein